MALTQYTADTDIIETLGTNPEDRPTLTDDTFKAKFDENAANIKTFLNAMIAELASTANGKGASQIGIEDSGSKFTATTVEAALAESATLISTNDGKLTTHTGETISQFVSATRDMSVAGTQTISCSGLPKMIRTKAMVSATYKRSDGAHCQNAQGSVYHNAAGYVYDGAAYPLIIEDTNGNYTAGTIGSVTNGSFTITWAKTGAGGTGTASLKFEILYH